MKMIRCFALFASVFFAVSAFADAANLLLSFSTVGPDKYADGQTTVKDGEWYALCWTTNEVFGGITTDLTPAVEGDKLMLAAPLAQDGHCPYAVFQVDSKEIPVGGKYFVYILDTRDANGNPAAATTKDGKRVPAMLNGAVASAKFTASGSATSKTIEKTEVAGAKWGESTVDTSAAGFTQAKIVAIAPAGDTVTITVSGMMPGVRYNIKAGEKVDNLNTYALDVPLTKDAQDNVPFTLGKEDGKFFQVVREPLSK